MAGDWIKMVHDLEGDLAVVTVALALDIPEDAVVGKLYRLWCWADKHTTDGTSTVPYEWVDQFVQAPGFAKALEKAGWLTEKGGGIALPNFHRHNGETAKRRAMSGRRMREWRERTDDVTDTRYISDSMREQIYARNGDRCVYCGKGEGRSVTGGWRRLVLDHVVPLARGGLTTSGNLVTACNFCNSRKSNRTPEEAGMTIRDNSEVLQ